MRWMRPAAMRWFLALCVTAHARTKARSSARTNANATSRLVFGSCSKVHLPQPLWPYVRARSPKAWIWAGDAVYGDRFVRALPLTFEAMGPQYLRDVYEEQNAIPEYARLREEVPYLIATWDDHDFGLNDGMISASRGAAAPSRRRRASSLGEEVVGGFFFDFEAVRTDLTESSAQARSSSATSASPCGGRRAAG